MTLRLPTRSQPTATSPVIRGFGGSEEYDCAIEHVTGSVGVNGIPDCGPDFLFGGREPLRRPKGADAPRQRSKSTLREVSEFQ